MIEFIRTWRWELANILLSIFIASILSYFIGHFSHMLAIIFAFVFIRQAVLITRLERWLSAGGKGKMPKASGVWDDIYYHFFNIKKSDKRRKKKLGKIIDQFRKSTDVLPDAAIVLGQFNEIEWSNKLSKEYLGIKRSDKGQRLDNLIRSPEFVTFLQKKKESASLIMLSPVDAHVILSFRIVGYGIGQHLLIAHDMTEQKKMEAMRKNFVDNVSHELRTPLTVIKGYLETLGDFVDEPALNMIEQMNGQTHRMQLLIDDLLLLARLETQKEKKECVDIPELLKNVCLEADAIDPLNERIEFQIESDCKIFGEKKDLHSAFTNIVINALKYSPPESQVKVIWKKTTSKLMLDVIDKGEGIKATEIPRITERFYRVDVKRSRKMSGTGLGLAIVKHVLIRHEAKLEVTSTVGKGSQFRCVFPLSRLCN